MTDTKIKFLKEYIAEQKLIDTTGAFGLLGEFYDNLPQKVRTKEREKIFCLISDLFHDAMNEQFEILAKCPFVKIVIDNQVQDEKNVKILDWLETNLNIMSGYIDGMAGSTRRLEERVKALDGLDSFGVKHE